MSTLKIGWGSKIALLYGGFVLLIAALVTGSMRQDFDLVADDYYQQEIAYQNVLDAGKNQSTLSKAVGIHATADVVVIEFPKEFENQLINGTVHFYSPIKGAWDREIEMKNITGDFTIPRSKLEKTKYTIKLSWTANETNYYQESDITLF